MTELPVALIWIVDSAGSIGMIVLAFVALATALRLSRREPENLLWSYLVALTMALGAFSVSRGFGHLARIVLLGMDRPDIWLQIAPLSGTANTATFIIIAAVTLFYRKAELGMRLIQRYTAKLENSYAMLEEAHLRLKMNQERIIALERRNLASKTVTSIAHQTRNPLQAIGGFARLISKNNGASKDVREKAEIIYAEATSLNALIDTILKTQRQVETEFKPVEAGEVLRQVASMNVDHAEGAGLRFDVSQANGPTVLVDRQLLLMALNEIIANAIEASSPGGAIRLEVRTDDGGMVFCVSDEGAGIPPEHAGMLLDPTFSTKEFSSGLGISFANEVAELHGGRLSFESRQGEGARFCLHLPIHAGPDAAPQD